MSLMRQAVAHAWDIHDYCVQHGIPATPPEYPRDFCDLSRRDRKRITQESRRRAILGLS